MRRSAFHLLIAAVLCSFAATAHAIPPNFGFVKHDKPYEEGMLKVSDLHEIHYEISGNPQGKPAIFLHGGPGVGLSPRSRTIFDPKKWKVVLFDQRGCGKSAPLYELRGNTTQDLVEDIEKLRRHLNLGKVLVVGGSWGSTLALAYAEKYPESVSGLILRAVFLGSKEEEDFIYRPGGVDQFFPEVFHRVAGEIRPGAKEIDRKRLLELIESDDPETSNKFSKLWSYYEIKITSLDAPDAVIEKILSGWSASKGLSLLETHYTLHDWFLKKDQILNDAENIRGIPLTMVQGRYDMMTPAISAWRLHQRLPESKLWIVEAAGHSDFELPIAKKLLDAVKEFE